MPSYNQSRYLREALDSVISQDYPRTELLVLDGGSNDGSAEIIHEYYDRLAFARSCPDDGQTAALIEGLDRSTGDLMGWLNSDDVLLPGALWKIARSYIRAPNASLIGGNFLLINAEGQILRCKRHPKHSAWWARSGLFTVNQPGSFFSRAAYVQAGGLNKELNYVMDTEFYVRLLNLQNSRFVHINEWLAAFRLHGANKTNQTELRDSEHARALNRYPIGPRRILGRTTWTWIYRVGQVTNGNYLRMAIETRGARGRQWQAWLDKTDHQQVSVSPTRIRSR